MLRQDLASGTDAREQRARLKRTKRSGGVYRIEDIDERWETEDQATRSRKRALEHEDIVQIWIQAEEPDLKRIKRENGADMGEQVGGQRLEKKGYRYQADAVH